MRIVSPAVSKRAEKKPRESSAVRKPDAVSGVFEPERIDGRKSCEGSTMQVKGVSEKEKGSF
jgi:hypothetical protein